VAVLNHGTVRAYKLGCRCEECTAANTVAKARERDRRREREGKPPAQKPTRTHKPESDPIEDGPGPIEEAARAALPAIGGDSLLAVMRREVVYRAAAAMDNPKLAPYFKSNADVMATTVDALIAESPAQDGEDDAIKELVASFGSRGRSRGGAAVDDAAESE